MALFYLLTITLLLIKWTLNHEYNDGTFSLQNKEVFLIWKIRKFKINNDKKSVLNFDIPQIEMWIVFVWSNSL